MCELWIRNQDKTLLAKYNRVAVAQVTPKTQAQVMGFVGYDFGYETLGKYETKERALEILDEIQNLLQPRIIVNGELDSEQENALCYFLSSKNVGKVMPRSIVDMNCIPLDTIVYEMPLE